MLRIFSKNIHANIDVNKKSTLILLCVLFRPSLTAWKGTFTRPLTAQPVPPGGREDGGMGAALILDQTVLGPEVNRLMPLPGSGPVGNVCDPPTDDVTTRVCVAVAVLTA